MYIEKRDTQSDIFVAYQIMGTVATSLMPPKRN